MGKALKIAGGVLAGIVLVLIIAFVAMRRGDIPYTKLEAKYGGADTHYVDLPGGLHVAYRDEGNPKGPVILMVHGFFVSQDSWKPWVKPLSDDYHIITLDLPGHGLTRAPAGYHGKLSDFVKVVDDFAQAEHLDHFVLAGHSMGGDLAWRYALAHPEKLTGLILVDSAGWPDPRPDAQKGLKQLQFLHSPIGRFAALNLDQTKRINQAMLSAYANPKYVTEEMVTKYAELGRAPGHRGVIVDLALEQPTRGYATPQMLSAITAPTLILQGDKDQLVPPGSASQFASAIKGSRLILYPGVGHVPQEEATDKSVADVRAFMVSLKPKVKKPAVATSTKSANMGRNPNTTIFY